MEDKKNSTAVLTNETQFASAERCQMHQIREINELIESTPHIKTLIDAMPFVVLILNHNRQIVAANQKVCSLLGVGIKDALGKRPGELIGCIHANDGPNGCGTNEYCRLCGAINTVLRCMDSGTKVTGECQIALQNGGALDWEVTASPLIVENRPLVCAGIRDISHEKRQRCLERIFFHDIINQLGAMSSFIGLIAEDYPDSEEINETKTLIGEVMEEIQGHQALTLAENDDLVPTFEPVQLPSLLSSLARLYQNHPLAEQCTVCTSGPQTLAIKTDAALLKRVLGNMLKNALEASSDGQTVTVSCQREPDGVSISVHNPAVIPEDTQLRIFNRSFSTKAGVGRGIGTYSMKLLGEKYLGGKVMFTSNHEAGTTFTITLPCT